ncbi:MAG: poly-gamma-glutamate system protein [Candidatus Marinimicrobia bacterium]|nr:poly-gamma-glutamate system protein [Candidatus Neomarinimicrobiota bacterium]
MLCILNLLMVYWAVNSYVQVPTYGYELKKSAAEKMEDCVELLEKVLYSEENIKIPYPNQHFLIGPERSEIQTTEGSFASKLSVLNPDFAAMITEMLIELEVEEGSHAAVAYTGSYPGANIAVLSALEAMGLEAIIISSCGSSSFGATQTEMTWIDMETLLYKRGSLSTKSRLASIGGCFDLGTQLSQKGKEVCEASIYNNNIELLNIEGKDENIDKRMSVYDAEKISVFINVGGGIISTGDSLQRAETPAGIIYPGDTNLDDSQTVLNRFLEKDIPVININHIHILSEWYELPYPPGKNYQHGEGTLFYSKKQYNSTVIFIALFLAAGTVLTVGIISHNEIKRRMHSSEPESFL